MSKIASNGVYAVLLERNFKEDSSVTEEPLDAVGEMQASKPKKCQCQLPTTCLGWSFLLAMSAACLVLLTFHLWITWHLQQKVVALQVQVDSLSALDLNEMRTQLRDLYDLRDSHAERESGLPGLPTSADEDEIEIPGSKSETAELTNIGNKMISDNQTEEIENGSMGSETFALDDEEVYLDESNEDTDLGDTSTEDNNPSSIDKQLTDARRKRQADLTAHTQDGVPIFDRGYGVSLNRTEGLRIYQSFLDTIGERGNEQRANNTYHQANIGISHSQHQRQQNSAWRGRKEKQGRHHQASIVPASSSDEDDTNLQPETPKESYRSSSSRSPTRNGAAGNVEFRQSRVKPSSNGSSAQPILHTDDQNVLLTPGASISSVSVVGTSILDERINAATAPAVLTQPATAFAGATLSNRARQQTQQNGSNHNVFKVTQPALISRYSTQTIAEDNLASRPSPISSNNNSPSNKKRVNKKQLRDLNHIATAAHLVADIRNSSTVNLENEGGEFFKVEIASRNELGLHTSWKLVTSAWESPLRSQALLKIDGATLTIKQSGLYFIYAQVHYLDEHQINAYEVFVNTEPFLRCVTSTHSESALPKANTCYTAGATSLREGDKLFLRDIEPLRYSVLQPSKTFFGLIRLAPLTDFFLNDQL